jgi:hypothetical protein
MSAGHSAAAHVDRTALTALFEGLERADDMLASDPRNPRAAVSAALTALVRLGQSSPHGGEGRFSRVVELLLEDLNSLPVATAGEIFPVVRGWSGRRRVRHAQACAAYALGLLRRRDDDTAPSVHEAATDVAAVLQAHGVPFAAGRTDAAEAVIAWGKGATAKATKDDLSRLRSHGPAIEADADAVQHRLAVLAWLGDALEQAGYDRA